MLIEELHLMSYLYTHGIEYVFIINLEYTRFFSILSKGLRYINPFNYADCNIVAEFFYL